MKKKKAKIICGFPGVGKTTLFNKNKKLKILDSDSSQFSWIGTKRIIRNPDFPNNYIGHIKNNIDSADIILVSTHDVVREALVKENIKFTLVYPSVEMKDEYIQRFIDRGSDRAFVKLLKTNYKKWIEELVSQKACGHIVLKKGQYISDVLN